MKNGNQLFLKLISVLITFFFAYMLVSLVIFNDFVTTLLPGWHTTIHPYGGGWYFTIIIASIALLLNAVFRLVLRFLVFIWNRALNKLQ
jgi:polyferredoxin